MRYNNRLFPHPVLNIGDDIEGVFKVELQVETNKDLIKISPRYQLKNSTLEKLIEEGQAVFTAQIYCRGTMFRETYETTETIPVPIQMKATRLNEQVEADFFICANNELSDYRNDGASPDYTGYTFDLEYGDILALGGSGKFFANKSPEKLKSVSAFMNINTSGKKDKPMYNSYDGRKITIMLPQKDYEKYQLIEKNKFYVNTLHSTIVLPALAEALHFMETQEAEEFSDNLWYELLEELKNKNQDSDPLMTAQKILALPVNRSFTSLTQLMDQPEVL
jgi:hypothetical protein